MTQQSNPNNPQVAHEPRDVPISGILYFLLCLVLVIAAAMTFLVYLFDWFDARAAANDPGAPPLASERAGPPAPRLQWSSTADLVAMRTAEVETLNSYGWIDAQGNILRIPIQRAMEIVIEQGLPRWSAPDQQQSEGQKPPPQPDLDAQQAPQQPAPQQPAPQQSAPADGSPMNEPQSSQPESGPATNGEAPDPSQPAPQDQSQPTELEVSDEVPASSRNESEQSQ